jgi:hypothetical protein
VVVVESIAYEDRSRGVMQRDETFFGASPRESLKLRAVLATHKAGNWAHLAQLQSKITLSGTEPLRGPELP